MGTTAQAVYVVDAPRNLMLQSDFAGVQTIYNLPVANCSGGEGFSVFHRNNLWIAEGNAICALGQFAPLWLVCERLIVSVCSHPVCCDRHHSRPAAVTAAARCFYGAQAAQLSPTDFGSPTSTLELCLAGNCALESLTDRVNETHTD